MQLEEQLDNEGFIYLGWANGWEDLPDKVKNCEHIQTHTQHNRRGTNNTIRCDECKWYYKVDSGD